MAVITWKTVPDYDEWGWDTFWKCDDWITWHKKLAEHFGEKTATEIWNYTFSKTTNLSSNLDCNSFDSAFRKYAKEHGLKPNTDLIVEVFGTSTDVLTGALGTTSNVASGLFGTVDGIFGGNNLKKTINIVLIAGGLIGIAYVYKSFKK
jgi:hypothetical protein